MGRVFEQYLDDAKNIHVCGRCSAHLADDDGLISRSFQGDLGRAYLFERAVNIQRGPPHERVLITGVHRVADIFCIGCMDRVGWAYIAAPKNNRSQNYKVGKILLEAVRVNLIKGEGIAKPTGSNPPPSDNQSIYDHFE